MIGKLLSDRYEILEKIGDGGMATVYKARCRVLDRYVAIKILRPEYANDEEFIKRIEKLLFFGSLDAEKYFKEINVDSNLSYISDAINSKYDNNYFTEIQNNWNTLYKKLQPYAHLPLFKNKNK